MGGTLGTRRLPIEGHGKGLSWTLNGNSFGTANAVMIELILATHSRSNTANGL